MSKRLALVVICALAIAHGVAYLIYQRPDWNVSWTDQGGFRMLGHGLAVGGGFTRYPGVEPFVPEAIRQPGYPLFVAAVYRVAGENQLAVAIAQIAVFALICLLSFFLGQRAAGTSAGLAAALVTAFYSPLPYFAALVLTELWTVFVVTATMLATWRAFDTKRLSWFAFAGFLFAYSALSRPVFILLGPSIAAVSLLAFARKANWRTELLHWSVVGVTMLATMTPWLAYNYRHFGIIDITPVGLGRPIFESSWQGVWPGRVQTSLTDAADSPLTEAELAAAVGQIADTHHLPVEPMLTYVSQWRRIHAIWDTPTDPQVRFRARIIAQEEYKRTGLENIRRDLPGFLKRRIVRGQFVLWAAEIPVRYSDINTLPEWVIRAIWLPQAVMVALAMVGAFALARLRRLDALVVLLAPLVYVGAVHFMLLTESRQSLPVKPLLIVLAVVGAGALINRRRRQPAST
jgi:4-amino-4-deoxy-L-arabinose transferase-like glycosyltransferase